MSVIKYFFPIVCCFLALSASSQSARSPFSSFGLGESYGNALVNTQGMAGVGVSQPQFWHINNQNPALLVYNTLTTFQVGVVGERRTISSELLSEKSSGGNLNYLAIAFPIKPLKWTSSIGLMPYTNVDYKIGYTEAIQGSTDMVNVVEEGTGGITQLYWSNGVKITDGLTAGVKAAYLFSSVVNNYRNQLPGAGLWTRLEEKSYVRDFTFGAGLSFTKDSLFSRNLYRLSFGAVYDFATDLRTLYTRRLSRTDVVGQTIDATGNILLDSLKSNIHIPSSITAGVSLSRGVRWSIGTEFQYRNWSTFRSVSQEDEGLGKSWRFSLGGETTPDPFAVANYLKRITYRMGVSMEQYPFMANNETVKDIGINFGFSLPTGRSSLDLAFKYGKRGNKAENVLEETYFKVFFGVTINEQWFIKRKFD